MENKPQDDKLNAEGAPDSWGFGVGAYRDKRRVATVEERARAKHIAVETARQQAAAALAAAGEARAELERTRIAPPTTPAGHAGLGRVQRMADPLTHCATIANATTAAVFASVDAQTVREGSLSDIAGASHTAITNIAKVARERGRTGEYTPDTIAAAVELAVKEI